MQCYPHIHAPEALAGRQPASQKPGARSAVGGYVGNAGTELRCFFLTYFFYSLRFWIPVTRKRRVSKRVVDSIE